MEITSQQVWVVLGSIGGTMTVLIGALVRYVNAKFKKCDEEKQQLSSEIIAIKSAMTKTNKPTMIRDFEGRIVSVNIPLMNQLFRPLGYKKQTELLSYRLEDLTLLSDNFRQGLSEAHEKLLLDPNKQVIRTGLKASNDITVGIYKSMYSDIVGVEYFETEFSINSK